MKWPLIRNFPKANDWWNKLQNNIQSQKCKLHEVKYYPNKYFPLFTLGKCSHFKNLHVGKLEGSIGINSPELCTYRKVCKHYEQV